MVTEPATPTLLILRGNSGSGKTTVAREVRRRYGRGCALVEQDHLRRIVLREHGSDTTPTVAPEFIAGTVRAALALGYHVVLEGILHTGQHGDLLRRLIAEHPGPTAVFWLEVSFPETLRRHQQRQWAAEVTNEQLGAWYKPLDLLGVPGEQVIAETSGFEQTVSAILQDSGLAEAAALTPCPVACPCCAEKRHDAAADSAGPAPAGGSTVACATPGPDDDRADGQAPIWAAVELARSWLDERNGTSDQELVMRIFKLVEEVGEVASAWTGTVGQNPRKGVTHTRQDVADELGDVALTALVAAASLGFDPQTVLERVARKVHTRLTSEPATPTDNPPPTTDDRTGAAADPTREEQRR